MKIDRLLVHATQIKDFNQMTISSQNSDEENNNTDNITVLRLVATGKRALSDSYNSCEPDPKKLRMDTYKITGHKYENTSSTNSYCSEEE